jgi:putative ABC transport system permease protein
MPRTIRTSGRRRRGPGPRLAIKALRTAPGPATALALISLLGTLLLVSTPGSFATAADEGLIAALENASATERNIELNRFSLIAASTGDDPLENVIVSGSRFRTGALDPEVGHTRRFTLPMPASVRAIVTGQTYVVDSPGYVASPIGDSPQWHSKLSVVFRFRYQESIADNIRVLDGDLPERAASIEVLADTGLRPDHDTGLCPPEVDPEPVAGRCLEEITVPLFEVALSAATLDELGMTIGDRLLLVPDRNDRAHQGVAAARLEYFLALEVTGTFEALDTDDPYWYEDLQLETPLVYENPDFALKFPLALISPDDYGRLLTRTQGAFWSYRWRYVVDPNLLGSSPVDQLKTDLQDLELHYRSILFDPRGLDSLSTGLSSLIARVEGQRSAAADLSALVVIISGAALLTAAGVSGTALSRRLGSLILMLRRRGTDRLRLHIWTWLVGLCAVIPAALAGFGVAAIRGDPIEWRPAAAFLAAVSIAAAAAARSAIRSNLPRHPRTLDDRTWSLGRVVAGTGIVVVAASTVLLLDRRASDTTEPAVDALSTMTPIAIAAAAAVIVAAVYSLPGRVGRRLLRRAGIGVRLGTGRIVGHPRAARSTIAALAMVAALGASVATIGHSIAAGQTDEAWQSTGADVRITGFDETARLPFGLDREALEASGPTAAGYRADVRLRQPPGYGTPIPFLALETARYEEVTAGREGHTPEVASLGQDQGGAGLGTDANPISALIGPSWPDDVALAPGDTFTLDIGGAQTAFLVTGTTERFPGLDADGPFVIADIDAIAGVGGVRLPTALYLRASEQTAVEIREVLADVPGTVVTTRYDVTSSIHRAPLVAMATRSTATAAWFTGIAGLVVAVAAGFIIGASGRAEARRLRAIGLSRRQRARTAIAETVLPGAVAVLAGLGSGVVAASIIATDLGLDRFTGPALEVQVRTPVVAIALALAATLLGVTSGVAVARSTRFEDDEAP